MLVFPNAKINLGLNVAAKRPDGYHDIETVFFPVLGLADALEVVESASFSFATSGLPVDCRPDDNLCVKAYRMLANIYNLPPAAIHLHKTIPSGAGLGGGSSDASFTLVALNEIFDLRLNADTLKSFAAKLGSDCPFFIDNVPAKASGRGEILAATNVNLNGTWLSIATPDIHVGTREAYAGVTPKPSVVDLAATVGKPPEEWKNTLQNDFEPSIFARYPAIARIKELFYESGAVYASMSGSGASVFGIFREKPELPFFKWLIVNC
ncbi:MAG: 4-(cytidine 5'-diphospho)-2-C-methyl-D-erythritol kinase [Prevotellaceae bacterium]|jgi:4-diphosphocytidyl-2-C-methyl-D-erythritol kinase|nr:4-(cytidine 5'-diphospho)-2-C-methyl-D-erythritol kinase [Prevotellaceae bacterium]